MLELGCGTGRVTMPLAHEGVHVVGVDRSAEMLARARRARAPPAARRPPDLVRGDIRHLPFPDAAFQMVMAPYGILQSLLSERDLKATLADVARVVEPDGIFGLELVADLPSWGEYRKRVSLRGRRDARRRRTSPCSSRSARTGPRASPSSTRSSWSGAAGPTRRTRSR